MITFLRDLLFLLLFIVKSSRSEDCPNGFHPFLESCVMNLEKQTFDYGCPFSEPLSMKYTKQYIFKYNESCWVPTKFNSNLGYFDWLEKDKWFGSPLNLNDFKPQPRRHKQKTVSQLFYKKPNLGKPILEDHQNLETLTLEEQNLESDRSIEDQKVEDQKVEDQNIEDQNIKHQNIENVEDCVIDATGEKSGQHLLSMNCKETNYHVCAYKMEETFCSSFLAITDLKPVSYEIISKIPEVSKIVNLKNNCSICLCLDEYQTSFFCAMDKCNKINKALGGDIFLREGQSSRKFISSRMEMSSRKRLAFEKNLTSPEEEAEQLNKLCQICQQTYQNYNDPTLKLINSKNDIYLVITSPLKLKISEHDDLPFSCLYDFQYMKGYNYNWIDDKQINSTIIYNDTITQKLIYQLKVNISIDKPIYPVIKFWCFGFKYPDMSLVKSNTIITGRTPIFNSKTNVTTSRILKDQPLGHLAQKNYSYGMSKNFSIYVQPISVHKILDNDFDNSSFEVTVRILLENHSHSAIENYENLTKIFFDHEIYSPEYCLPEIEDIVEQTSVNGQTSRTTQNITWPSAFIGQTILSYKACTDQDNNFVTRTCLGDIMDKTFWVQHGTCTKIPSLQITDELQNIFISSDNAHVKTLRLRDFLMGNQILLPEDVYLVAKVIESIIESKDSFIRQTMLESISSIMDLDGNLLGKAQESLNATDKIVGNLEKMLEEVTDVSIGYDINLDTSNIMIQTVDLKNGYVSGWGVYKDNMVSIMNRDTSFETLYNRDLIYAIKIPNELLTQILRYQDETRESEPIVLVGALYKKRSLFQGQPRVIQNTSYVNFTDLNSQTLKAISWVSNIFVPGFTQPFFNAPIQILVTSFRRYKQPKYCAFWDYGFNDNASSKKGAWIIQDSPMELSPFYVCEFWHMAHFALVFEPDSVEFLDYFVIMAAFVSGLSSLSLIIYSLFFKNCRNWKEERKEVGTSILLNYSVTVLIKVSAFVADGFTDSYEQETACLVIAVSLHYISICQFSWLTNINYLQYKKTVHGKTQLSADFFRNSLFVGWIVPAIPVAINFSMGSTAYLRDEFCYATGNELKFAALVPSFILLGMNLIIFIKVWVFLKRSKLISWCRGINSNGSIYQNVPYKLICFIFLFLELSWFFALSNGFTRNELEAGLYCLFECLLALCIILLYVMWNGSFEKFMRNVRACFWKVNCRRCVRNKN